MIQLYCLHRCAACTAGTPITSRLNEIQGLCEFLAYEPMYRMASWRHLLQLPFQSRSPGMGVILPLGLALPEQSHVPPSVAHLSSLLPAAALDVMPGHGLT